MILFSVLLLWKNEKKLVSFAKLVDTGRNECTNINAGEPNDENNFQLVHTIGKTFNSEEISDKIFAATCKNSYRLVRTVEMY